MGDIDWNCWKCRCQLQALYNSGSRADSALIRANLDRHIESGKHEKAR